jgi:hypothetical protein
MKFGDKILHSSSRYHVGACRARKIFLAKACFKAFRPVLLAGFVPESRPVRFYWARRTQISTDFFHHT